MKAEQTFLNAKMRSAIEGRKDGGACLTLCIIYACECSALNVFAIGV